MDIKAATVKALRDRTGAGMMDCKKALIEAEGDMDKAIEILRKKGSATAEKRSERSANEGVVITDIENGNGVILEVNCETDFVARSDDFLQFANDTMQIIKNHKPSGVPDLLETGHSGKKVLDTLTETIGKIGEKIEVKRFAAFESDGRIVDYIHPGSKLGVMVEISSGESNEEIDGLGKDLAMQIAAMNPIAIDRESVSDEQKENELNIYRQQALEQGKPENIVERIAEGKLNKYFQEYTLLEQSYIRDNTKTVKERIDEVAESTGQSLSVVHFVRFQVGESS